MPLPALQIEGQPARAHTQGLEIVDGRYYVTARREDVAPKRALLLRTDATRANWDAWDITPSETSGKLTSLDHPGGLQSDGQRLWIPVAESKRGGRSLLRVFDLGKLTPGRKLQPEFEVEVNDHIGALAVAANRQLVFGANWDTEAVYIWDTQGHLQRKMTPDELQRRSLGVSSSVTSGGGIAVQDWKAVGDQLVLSGLFRPAGSAGAQPLSRLVVWNGFEAQAGAGWSCALPLQDGTELAREAMALSAGLVHFLPEDLGATNRLFKVTLAALSAHRQSSD
jgi:hypothetical protein